VLPEGLDSELIALLNLDHDSLGLTNEKMILRDAFVDAILGTVALKLSSRR